MSRLYTGNVESVTFEGRTFDVFDDVIDETNHKISEAVLGTSLSTDPTASSSMSAKLRLDWFRRSSAPFEFTCDVVIGIRDARRLLTGRPRHPRAVTKRLNRETRAARRELVHAAGCVFERCISRMVGRDAESLATDPAPGRVSVPRSLRPLLGRWLGGGK
jgi:hypothetical protein